MYTARSTMNTLAAAAAIARTKAAWRALTTAAPATTTLCACRSIRSSHSSSAQRPYPQRTTAAAAAASPPRRLFSSSALSALPSRDPLQAEREAATVAGNRAARERAAQHARIERQIESSGDAGSASGKGEQGGKGGGSTFSEAWKNTPIKWYPIPILLGAVVLVGVRARRNYLADQSGGRGKVVDENGTIITMSGPWTVYVLGALPLNAISRLWGWANNLTLPVWFRPFGFKLYARIFGCNLDEMKDPDLTHYKSLGEFFYRELKDGVRTIDEEAPIVSPADGTVLHFGTIKGRQVEQVKGLTYSLDALLGLSSSPQGIDEARSGPGSRLNDKQFAAINGIDYSLDRLLGDERAKKGSKRWWKLPWLFGGSSSSKSKDSVQAADDASSLKDRAKDANTTGIPPSATSHLHERQSDASTATSASESDPDSDSDSDEPDAGLETPDSPEILSRYASVAYEMGSGALPPILQKHSPGQEGVAEGNKLHFAVIYLAPGDYHHFHSPTNWVAERRRHFRGELYSVSPYIASRLSNLFILNERVALLGRWRYGFFSMIPVGATNVGSIRVNFDADLRTNLREQRRLAGTFSEATYARASRLLGGQPLSKGEEMGGFLLGSTVVLVWESPEFTFDVQPGQKVRMGQRLGDLGENPEMSERERRKHEGAKRWWFF